MLKFEPIDKNQKLMRLCMQGEGDKVSTIIELVSSYWYKPLEIKGNSLTGMEIYFPRKNKNAEVLLFKYREMEASSLVAIISLIQQDYFQLEGKEALKFMELLYRVSTKNETSLNLGMCLDEDVDEALVKYDKANQKLTLFYPPKHEKMRGKNFCNLLSVKKTLAKALFLPRLYVDIPNTRPVIESLKAAS